MRDIIAGCCQFSVKPGDVDANLVTAERELSLLSAQDCRLAVLPEMWSCSFPYSILPSMAERTPEVVEKVRDWARQKEMVIVGSLPEAEGDTIYNTSYVIDSTGEIAGTYRKVHLFSLYGEHKNFGRGKSAEVFSTSVGKIGAIICYDLRFPELTRKMALAGAEIICVSALWPHVRIYHWSLLLRARAVENQIFVAAANGCGNEEKIIWGGRSALISPWGEVLSIGGSEDQTIVGTLQSRDMEEFRKIIPCFDDRSPEAY
ncbi:MAG: carbon-nitrogen family hydrolase [Syntrophobacteraceae bacterium]